MKITKFEGRTETDENGMPKSISVMSVNTHSVDAVVSLKLYVCLTNRPAVVKTDEAAAGRADFTDIEARAALVQRVADLVKSIESDGQTIALEVGYRVADTEPVRAVAYVDPAPHGGEWISVAYPDDPQQRGRLELFGLKALQREENERVKEEAEQEATLDSLFAAIAALRGQGE